MVPSGTSAALYYMLSLETMVCCSAQYFIFKKEIMNVHICGVLNSPEPTAQVTKYYSFLSDIRLSVGKSKKNL